MFFFTRKTIIMAAWGKSRKVFGRRNRIRSNDDRLECISYYNLHDNFDAVDDQDNNDDLLSTTGSDATPVAATAEPGDPGSKLYFLHYRLNEFRGIVEHGEEPLNNCSDEVMHIYEVNLKPYCFCKIHGRYNHRKGPKKTEKDRKGPKRTEKGPKRAEKELLMYYSPKRRRKVGNGTQGDGKQIIKGNKK